MRTVARAAALVTLLAAAGCASSGAFRAGEKAERQQDYDRAVLQYSKALQSAPSNLTYKKSLERARLRASGDHASAARRLMGRGLYKEALDEFRLALDLNPGSSTLSAEMREAEARRREGTSTASLEELKSRVRERALPGLELSPAANEPLGLSFRNASLRETYQALGQAAGVNFIFDSQLQDQPITIDLRGVGFEQALAALSRVGHTFYRVVESNVVLVIPDNANKRHDYEQQIVKTFFLSNADLKDTIDLLRIVLGARRVAPLPGANALTINDEPDKVAAAERIIEVVDKQRPEVVVEVEILEVNRTRLSEYGIEITSPGLEGVAGAIFPAEKVQEVVRDAQGNPVVDFRGVPATQDRALNVGDNPYKRSNLLITSLPGVLYRLLRTDSTTHILANPQLRTAEGQTAQARFGDQVPIPVTTFSPIATGGVSQQPITSFDYKNVGVNIDITPRVHHDGDVSLTLKLEISSVGAPGFGGLPTINSRTVTSVIRLHDGETNLLAGLISNTERESLRGLPGLSKLPVLGRLFSSNHTESNETDIVMTLTPHVVRRLKLTEGDLRSFQLGSETSPLIFEIPAIPPVATPKVQEAPKIEPIRPPSPQPSPTPSAP